MFLTQKNAIRGQRVREFNALRTLCRLSKNMFNVGLYTVRPHELAERSHLAYESVAHQVKNNENYKLLSTDIAQRTLKIVDRSFKSFVKLTEAVRDRLYFQKVNMPYYLPYQGCLMLIIPRIKVKDGFFNVPMLPALKKKYCEVRIPHYALRFKLKALCERYGIAYREQEKSYRSSASFLDQDDLPIYNADNPQEYIFSGQRICRGLYKSKNSTLIKADCNGAANILKKSNHKLDFQGVARGLVLVDRGAIANRSLYELIS